MNSPHQKQLPNSSELGIARVAYRKRKFEPDVSCNEAIASDSKRFHNLESHEAGLLLWRAIKKDDLVTAKMLIRAGVDLTLPDPDCPEEKRSFLHCVTVKGQEGLALLMLKHGAEVDARDAEGKSALYYAVKNDLLLLVEELVQRNATVLDSQDEYNSKTCVLKLIAGKRDPKQLLNLLVFSCKDDNERNRRAGIVAMAYFVIEDVSKLNMLWSRGLPVDDYADTFGYTMLHRAIIALNIEMVKVLLDLGANVNRLMNNDVSPLQMALIWHRSPLPVMLMEKGANIHAVDKGGSGPFQMACQSQSGRYIELLLQLGVDVNVVDKNGRTPFSYMTCIDPVSGGESKVIEQFAVLIASGRPVNSSDLEIIKSKVVASDIFKSCLNELSDMKETNVMVNISYFSILCKSSTELFQLARNKEFLKALKSKSEESAKLFPTYFQRITMLTKIAEEKQKLLRLAEISLTTAFDSILPQVVMDKIAFYSKSEEINSMEKRYYLSLHKDMNK